MGNSLLDFVMGLVRDPDAAARYAADPAAALAGAQLTGVTVADVENLIPVVTDSLAASTPGFGAVVGTPNVWATGAAAAAFDAFDIHVPQPQTAGDQPAGPAVSMPTTDPIIEYEVPDPPAVDLPVDPTAADHPITPEWPDEGAWHADPQTDHHPGDPGFEIF